MKENNTDSKLDTKPVLNEIGQTSTKKNSASQKARPRFKIKFTDHAIEKFTSSFIDPITNKTKYRVYTPFDISKHSALKGLKLVQFFKGKKKYFFLKYWYNERALPLTIGQFIPGVFGVKQCEDRVYDLVKANCNDKGHWIRDPKH